MLEAGIKDEEVELLVSDLLDVWGYDFSDYSRASLKRRMSRLFKMGKFPSFAEWRYKLRTDPEYLKNICRRHHCQCHGDVPRSFFL